MKVATFYKNLSIRNKLISLILFVTVFAMDIAYLLVMVRDIKENRRDMIENTSITAQVIADYCVAPLLFKDTDGAQNILGKLSNMPSFNLAVLYTDETNVFTSYPAEIDTLALVERFESNTAYFEGNYLHVFKPVSDDNDFYGTIYMRMSTHHLRARIKTQFATLFLLMCGIIVICIFLAAKLQKLISKPILNLAEIVRHILETGNFRVQAIKMTNDETGLLVDGFNNMLEKIRVREIERDQAVETLEKHQNKLEELVQKRTEELTTANAQLQAEIEERNQAEERVREREETYRIVVEQTGQMVYDFDLKNASVLWLGDIEGITGYAPDEFDIMDLSDTRKRVHPDDLDMIQEKYHLAMSRETKFNVEYRFLDKNSGYRYIKDNGVFLRDEKGDVIRVLGTMEDITEQKDIEKELRKSEERFRSLVENANDVIYSLTPKGKLTYISPKFKDILGYEVADYLGQSFFPLLHPDDAHGAVEWFREGIETINEQSSYEFRFIHKNGDIRWMGGNSSVITDENGKAIEIIGVAHDYTQMKKILSDLEDANQHLMDTQAQLVQSAKMASLGQLVAGIAHEINTPIGAVNSMQDTLFRTLDKYRAVLEAQDQLKKVMGVVDNAKKVINNGTERVITIVRRLRSFARLDEAELKTVDVHEGLEDTLTLVHHEIKHTIEIRKKYGDLPQVACYPGRLNQVFLNILVNAKHAIADKGIVEIATFVKKGRIYITIKDNGKGIAPEHLGRIFDPGFTTKGVGVGTGLGLSICYQIMQEHRGAIEVESTVGKGTTFTVWFPVNLEEILEKE